MTRRGLSARSSPGCREPDLRLVQNTALNYSRDQRRSGRPTARMHAHAGLLQSLQLLLADACNARRDSTGSEEWQASSCRISKFCMRLMRWPADSLRTLLPTSLVRTLTTDQGNHQIVVVSYHDEQTWFLIAMYLRLQNFF